MFLKLSLRVHKNISLAANHHSGRAYQGYLDGAHNLGFSLAYGRGVIHNSEFARDDFKFAADRGHSEARSNCSRCLPLLDRWEPSDHSSNAVSHSPSVNHCVGIFTGLTDNPELQRDDCRLLQRLFEPLKLKVRTGYRWFQFHSRFHEVQMRLDAQRRPQ
jgi:TPR repeat protein